MDKAANPVVRMALMWERLSDVEFLDDEYPDSIADDFLREDRRRLITLPPSQSSIDTTDAVRVWHAMAPGGAQFTVEEIIAHRGCRLALSRNRIHVDGTYTELLSLVQLDRNAELLERVVFFDADDREQALIELDARHAEFDA